MGAHDIVEIGNVPTIYADAFENHQVINGSMRCTGYVISDGELPGFGPVKIAVVKIIVSCAGVLQSIESAQRALAQPVEARSLSDSKHH